MKKNILLIVISTMTLIIILSFIAVISRIYFPVSVVGENLEQNNININNSQSFCAKIKKINNNYVLVEGYYDNYRGEYDFTITNTTDLLFKEEKIDISRLKVGDYIKITFNGYILERYPAGITNVTQVQVVNR